MKKETLELIIEVLASALNCEKVCNEYLREENSRLKSELAELKTQLDSKCAGCEGRAKEGDNG